jgi:hypothetical protein
LTKVSAKGLYDAISVSDCLSKVSSKGVMPRSSSTLSASLMVHQRYVGQPEGVLPRGFMIISASLAVCHMYIGQTVSVAGIISDLKRISLTLLASLKVRQKYVSQGVHVASMIHHQL